MRTSLEKIHDLAREYSAPPGPDAEGLELIIRTTVMSVGPMFLQVLPDDPAELDQAIESIALQLLELRSDGARELELVADAGDGQAQVLELPAGEP